MVVTVNMPGWNEIRSADGRVFAVVVSPDEFARMQAEVQALRGETEKLRARVNEMIQTWVLALVTPEATAEADPGAGDLTAFIVNKEAR